ncbi:MAG: hypothetical protein GW903_04655 [Alphaproteobacteria bacterium]|nr:hypothetical protein [Alphaproteobacteria bacterium]NCQ88261.1 hypothetical protein [Alphaproteobacteria bacterium]NCT05232.1 hypothetical protein [Alphaproteobacteria bacterium]
MALGKLRSWFMGSGASAPAAAPRPQDRQFDGPPIPTGEWGLIVNKFGDPVIGRKPDGTDFIARYPLEYDYRGTIPAYDPHKYKTREERIAAGMAHAVRDHQNRTLLKKAVFLLSQTDDGRRLLSMAQREGFHFVFDQDRMEKEGALGLCDYTKKQIPLAEGQTAENVALILKHELQHMDDGKNGASYNINHTLTSALMCDRAKESNARVSEAIQCAESLNGNPRGPERQFRTSALFAELYKSWPHMAQIAHDNLALAKDGTWNNFARAVFDGYFQEQGTLDYYDLRQVEKRFNNDEDRGITTPKPPIINKPVSMATCDKADHSASRLHDAKVKHWTARLDGIAENDRWTHDQDTLKKAITVKGSHTPYLMGDSSPDLTTAQYIGFGAKAKELLNTTLKIAAQFAPDRVQEIETGLMAPDRQQAAQTTITSPYTRDQRSDDFQMIRHPERHDYKGYELRSSKSDHTITTENFAKAYDDYKDCYGGELNRLSLAVEYAYRNGNMRGSVASMVEAGFRAPLAAFPQEYIMDLCKMVQHVEQTGEMPQYSDAELQLFSHWKQMAERGLDPVYGTEELKETATLFDDQSKGYYEGYLKPFFDKIITENAPKQDHAHQPRATV